MTDEDVYVTPFYLLLLHGNLVHEPPAKRAAVVAELRRLAPEVTFERVRPWWATSWRPSLVASWWAAVHRWPGTPEVLRPRLVPSLQCYAGQMHCLALARLGTPDAVEVLTHYLDVYGPQPSVEYDQRWAMASLRIAAPDAGADYAARYPWFAEPITDATVRAMYALAATVEPVP